MIIDYEVGLVKRGNAYYPYNEIMAQEMADKYNEAFADVPEIVTQSTGSTMRHGWHIFTILLDSGINRNDFFTRTREKNIGVNLHYIPIYKFTYYRNNFKIDDGEYPVTEDIFERIVTLPLYPLMSNEDVLSVIDATMTSIKELSNYRR